MKSVATERVSAVRKSPSGPAHLGKLSLATCGDLRDNAGMTPQLTALFLLTGSCGAVTLAAGMHVSFPRLETRFTLVVTLLLVYVLLTLAPLVFLPVQVLQ